ncbi:MAG: DUF1552 domain-containing protein [Myxococcales bacterium]|nr:MAG: DUF1552 domain-containing protein [Myxococcales bacterium]
MLRGAGSIAVALPWLEAMAPERSARAAAAPAKRFIGVYTPGGTVLEKWRPIGSEESFELSPILAPLQAMKSRVLVVDGIDMTCAVGEQDQAGLVGLWTGTSQSGSATGYASGPSIDQVLAERLSTGQRLASLPLAVRWGTGKARGLPSPMNIANYATAPGHAPIVPRLDPIQVWEDLFGTSDLAEAGAWDKSILDALGRRYSKLAERLGAADRARLEEHLTHVRHLETRVRAFSSCSRPELVDTTGYDPRAGLESSEGVEVTSPTTDAAIPSVGKLMMDLLVMALACDLTSVATLMWSDTEAKHSLPWLGLRDNLHYYVRGGGYHPEELTQAFTWYVQQHAYLLEKLSQCQTANGTLLDESVVFFGSHIQRPPTSGKTDMPFLLGGSGGGLRTGRWMQNAHRSHNDLLVSILNLCGDERQTFGAAEFCAGPLGGLT